MKYDYDLIALGGGAAGLVAVTGGASLGARTALIEKNKLGGDCTWYGCIPSKALLKSAGIYSLSKRFKDFGISTSSDNKYDATAVMAHVRDVIQKISTHHSAEVFERRGIKVLFGSPRFIDSKTLELDGKKISAKRFIICTGSHPLVPPIEGLRSINYLTNETIFDLESLPESLAILGGGPIGIEMAQAFAKLGVRVSVIEMMERILFREDKETAAVLTDILIKEGSKIYTKQKAVKFCQEKDSVAITMEDNNKKLSVINAQKVLVAIGRAPNVEGLDLEKAGVKYGKKGIEADMTLKTGAKNIYAAGDVAGPYQFSHMAEYQAIIAVGNALFPFNRKVDYCCVPWCTFTEPELAHLGFTEEEAKAQYKNIKVFRSKYSAGDRAVTDLEENGFAKVICDKRGYILGAHIVGTNAGELIHEYVLAKTNKLHIGKLSSAIHIYPTLAQVVKRTGDQYFTGILESNWFKLFSKICLKFLR
ncbi:MAG: FAD-dependent oxidoreductase [Candidatus Aureabacteria bacterium]|nr:FAD-dependent oxidoreductase [Candidatus Auribacterota bacterium]